jgi:hypothetical protein
MHFEDSPNDIKFTPGGSPLQSSVRSLGKLASRIESAYVGQNAKALDRSEILRIRRANQGLCDEHGQHKTPENESDEYHAPAPTHDSFS